MLEEGGSSGSVFLNLFRIEAWLELLNYIVRWQRAMVGIGLPCSSSLPAVGSAVRMRPHKSGTGVGGGTSRLWLLTDGVGAAWEHGVGADARGGVSRKHVGVDKRAGAELNLDEPDTDSSG